jgi:Rha family phage regulatory protein
MTAAITHHGGQPATMNTAPVSMTSREIAELTGKRHDNVLLDIKAMLVELGFHSPEFSGQYKDATGRTLPMFKLPKRETLILVSGYSVPMRAKIIDRVAELEAQASQPTIQLPDFSNPAAAARAWANAVEQKQVLQMEAAQTQQLLSTAQPKAEALDRIAQADGTMNITNTAKTLQMPPKKFFLWLQEHQWIYRRAGGRGWVGYQTRIQAGLLEHKVTTVERGDGSVKTVEQVLVTAKGLAKLAMVIGQSAEVSE